MSANQVIISYTWWGDADLDGILDNNDYVVWAYGSSSGGGVSGWFVGDFNYDGSIDNNDLGIWAYVDCYAYDLGYNVS